METTVRVSPVVGGSRLVGPVVIALLALSNAHATQTAADLNDPCGAMPNYGGLR